MRRLKGGLTAGLLAVFLFVQPMALLADENQTAGTNGQVTEEAGDLSATKPEVTITPTPNPTSSPTPSATPTETPAVPGTFDDGAEEGDQILDPEILAQITHAYNIADQAVPISDAVRARIETQLISVLKEGDGYRLFNAATGRCVDPEDGSDYYLAGDIVPQEQEMERDEESEEAARESGMRAETNEELIARQVIVTPPEIEEDYRFWTVSRTYAFAKKDLSVMEEPSVEAAEIGRLKEKGLCFVLQQENGYAYIESGEVRGFVPEEDLKIGSDADALLRVMRKKASVKAKLAGELYLAVSKVAGLAEPLVDHTENAAYTYLRATTQKTVVPKQYALVEGEDVAIYEEPSIESRQVGKTEHETLVFVLADVSEEWAYVESGNVRGFILKIGFASGDDIDAYIEENGEDAFPIAEETVPVMENKAFYYTKTSTMAGVPGGQVREAMIAYASQFVGNPYVWGGTDPVNGADCSGFAMRMYEAFGYALPRVSESQSQYGMKIPVDAAAPGDLIFYANAGHVYHVVIYAGNGTTIEAANESVGIVRSRVDYGHAVWATRIFADAPEDGIDVSVLDEDNAEEAKIGDSLGEFHLSYFCSCERCADATTTVSSAGTRFVQGQTVAADPDIVEPGSRIVIDGHVFTVQETGREVKGNYIEIYVNDHEDAHTLGRRTAEVFVYR